MFWHIETDVFSLIIVAILYYDLRRYDLSTLKQDTLFRQIAVCMLIVNVVDIAASLTMDFSRSVLLYQLMMTLYFSIQPVLSVFWLYYSLVVVKPSRNRARDRVMAFCCLPYAAYLVIVLLNSSLGTMFTLTPDFVYARGPYFFSCVLIFAVYSLMNVFFVLAHIKSIVPRSRVLTLLLSPVLLALAVWVQLSYPGSLLINAAYTTVFVINYYYIQNRRPQVDSLTGAYSRSTGQQRITEIIQYRSRASAALLMFDLDNFKRVNDTLGHIVGDDTLRGAARALRAAFPHESVIIRMGGDEFMVYLQEHTDRAELSACLVKLNAALARIVPMDMIEEPLSASAGVAFYPQDGGCFDDLYACADRALAAAKANGKARLEFYN